jgi:glyoxylase-like metal-dependent hydrolase (beta-lactamase superfamily II)
MIIEILQVGVFQSNCYIIGDEKTGKGIIIDPGAEGKAILDKCREHKLDIEYILLTHGHGDHIGAVADVKAETEAKVCISRKDEYLIKGETKRLIPILRNIKLFDADMFIKEGDIINVGGLEIEVLETPGHTPGGLSFKIGSNVFCGDSLFRGSVGRTDFQFGSMDQLVEGIRNNILTLPGDTVVYPGHGPSTTVEVEKRFNPYIKE